MNDPIIAQVPNFDEAVGATGGDPLRIRALPDRVYLFCVLTEGGYALLLTLVPDTDLGIGTTCEEGGVMHRCAQGGACGLVTSECSNLLLLLDIPRHSHAALRARKQLLDTVVEDHATGRGTAHHALARGRLSELPDQYVVLVITCCQHVAPIWANLGTCVISAATHKVIVFFLQSFLLH